MKHLCLGLDLGTASIGWSLTEVTETEDETGEKYLEDFEIVALGSRIFPEPVNDRKILLNKGRRSFFLQ